MVDEIRDTQRKSRKLLQRSEKTAAGKNKKANCLRQAINCAERDCKIN